MPLGNLLIDKNMLNPDQLERARVHQKTAGGSLVDSLLALDLISSEELAALLGAPPPEPESIEETGLDGAFLLDFILKAVSLTGFETIHALSDYTKLPPGVIHEVLEDAKAKQLIEVLGLSEGGGSAYRYALTSEGRRWALDAFQSCQYTGPAPVPIARWQEQVVRQSINNDHVTPEAASSALAHMVLPEDMLGRLGPAINSGRAILVYGGVGNGKTSIAEAVGNAFPQKIWLPYCVEVAGQIIKLFDPAVHHAVEKNDNDEETDARWVQCHRPVIVTGGELTLEMLDLSFDEISKTYEAPAHVKATGGVFIVYDFGRQRVRAQDLLNRWIFPLERRVDFLTLHTGMKIQVVFDQLAVFSTNFAPKELVDDAGLRRIPYKFNIAAPDRQIYTEILERLCAARNVDMPASVVSYLLDRFYPMTKLPISGAHPAFIVEHVIERCRFDGREPKMDLDLVREAAQHLCVDAEAPEPDPVLCQE
jgi:DNA-binding PadR family transcriptional regulator